MKTIFFLAVSGGIGIAAMMLLQQMWGLRQLSHVPQEIAARVILRPCSAAGLRRAFVRSVTRENVVMASGATFAAASLSVRIAPGDAYKLHPMGDLAAIERDAAEFYVRHAEREMWTVLTPPVVHVEIDERLRPGWVAPTRACAPADEVHEARNPAIDPLGAYQEHNAPSRPVTHDGTTAVLGNSPATQAVLEIEYNGATYVVGDTTLGLGRKHNGYFELNERTTSFKHALLEQRDGRWTVRDLESINGTRLDGKKLTPGIPVAVPSSCELVLGEARLRLTSGSI